MIETRVREALDRLLGWLIEQAREERADLGRWEDDGGAQRQH